MSGDLAADARGRLKPDQVEIDLLLYFIAVAEELSFTRAAISLGIDQSWLSHKIRQLEAKLEVDLFVRNTRHVDLTEAGRALMEPARRLRRAAEEARKAACMLREGMEGSLRVGALPFSFRDNHRTWLIGQFREHHPDIQLSVASGPTPMLIEKVRRGELDAAIVSAPFVQDGLSILLLGEDAYQLLVPSEHPLAQQPTVTLEDMAGQRVVMPMVAFNPITFASYYQPFIDAGVIHVPPPEFQGAVDYAVRWRLPTMCKVSAGQAALVAGFVARELPGAPVICEKYLVRAQATGPAVDALWKIASSPRPKRVGRRRA